MVRKHVNRRGFLKGVAAVGLGTVGAQLLAACAPVPAAPAAQAPSTTNAGKANTLAVSELNPTLNELARPPVELTLHAGF